MGNKEYFYLDGADKKGPYSKQEIIDLKLSGNRLIFSEDLNKWIPYQESEDFKSVIEETKNETQKLKVKKNSNFTNILVLLFLILSASAIAYYLTEEFKRKDLQKLENKINDVFNKKHEICDYSKSYVKSKPTQLDDITLIEIRNNKRYFDDLDLYDYYNCESGGWTVYTLKKLNHGYDLIKSYSTDMGFKVPESTYRGSVQDAYNEAMEYLSVENAHKSYVAGSYNRISTFNELNSDLHYVGNVHPTRSTSVTFRSKTWNSASEFSISNENWIVWYKESGNHYEIVLDKDDYYRKLLINLGICIAIAILTFLLWIYSLKNK